MYGPAALATHPYEQSPDAFMGCGNEAMLEGSDGRGKNNLGHRKKLGNHRYRIGELKIHGKVQKSWI